MDSETISVYSAQVDDYARATVDEKNDPQLITFIGALPANSRVLDLGCGPGYAAAQMAQAGHSVDATDATPEMVEMAAQHAGVTAWIATFDEIEGDDLYDGIWANFSLLHAARSDMPRHLAAIRQALKPGELFHIGMKTGTGEKRDALGRVYTYYTEDELSGLLREAGMTPFSSVPDEGIGLDGAPFTSVTIAAHG